MNVWQQRKLFGRLAVKYIREDQRWVVFVDGEEAGFARTNASWTVKIGYVWHHGGSWRCCDLEDNPVGISRSSRHDAAEALYVQRFGHPDLPRRAS